MNVFLTKLRFRSRPQPSSNLSLRKTKLWKQHRSSSPYRVLRDEVHQKASFVKAVTSRGIAAQRTDHSSAEPDRAMGECPPRRSRRAA